MGWLRVRRIRKGWAKADSLGQVIRGLRGPAKKGRLWQWLREPPWVSKPEVSLLHLLEGFSGGRDSLRQGGGQGALQPSCDRDPTRVTAVRVGKRARSQKTWGLTGPATDGGLRGDVSVCGLGGLENQEWLRPQWAVSHSANNYWMSTAHEALLQALGRKQRTKPSSCPHWFSILLGRDGQ